MTPIKFKKTMKTKNYFFRLLLFTALITFCNLQYSYGQDWDDCNKSKKFKRYREGVCDTKVNTNNELLSLYSHFEGYSKKYEKLFIEFFTWGKRYYSIKARTIFTNDHYRMESKRTKPKDEKWDKFGPWRTNKILKKKKISSSTLGILVDLEKNIYAPAIVYHTKAPSKINDYRFKVKFGSRSPGGSLILEHTGTGKTYSGNIGPKLGGAIGEYKVDMQRLGDESGLIKVRIKMEGLDELYFGFYHTKY